MQHKNIMVSTSFLLGTIIFLILSALPTAQLYLNIKDIYAEICSKIPDLYNKMNIPAITYSNYEARSNNDELFQKEIKGENNSGIYYFFIDTSEHPDLSLKEKISQNLGGCIIYRDRIVFNDNKNNRYFDKTYKELNINIDLDVTKESVTQFLLKFNNVLLIILISLAFICYFLIKLFWWLVIAFIYSGKAKLCGGGNYSLALWALVPSTVSQLFLPIYGKLGCCSCGVNFIVLVISIIVLEKNLKTTIKD